MAPAICDAAKSVGYRISTRIARSFGDQVLDLIGIEQGISIGIIRNCAELGKVARTHASHVATFDDPFFQAADDEFGIDAHLRHRLSGFRAAIAVVAEQDDLLVGQIEIGLLKIRKPNDCRALQRAHHLFGVFTDIEENVVVGFAAIMGCKQLGGFRGADPQRMLALIGVIELLGVRVVRQARGGAGRPQQRLLQPRLAFVLLLDVLIDVEARRHAEQDEHDDGADGEPARETMPAAPPPRRVRIVA